MLQRGRKSSANLTVLPTATPRHHIAAPDNLSATERRTFEQVLLNAAPNYFTKNDTPLLAAYVQALGLMQHYAKKAHDDPRLVKPYSMAARTVVLLATKLRLAPSARMSPSVAATTAAKRERLSAYDLMEMEDDADDNNR